MDILTLLGEGARLYALQYQAVSMLNLPICTQVGYHGPVHPDVVAITEIQEFFPGEVSTIVGDNGVRDLKQKMMSWLKFTACLELIFARGLASIHLVNLSSVTSRWVKPPGAFLKGPKRSRPQT
jgi:hypothetical protein